MFSSVSSRFISFRLPHSLLSHCQFFLHFHSPSRPNRAFSANPNSFPRHESAISKSESNFPSSSIHKPSISANSLDFDLITVLETLACYANDWKRALEFFNWVETDCGFDHCTETYNRVIDILGKFFEFDIAWDLIDKMRKFEDSVPDHITFRIMFKRYISAHLVAEAISVYERMEQFNLKDEISFSNLIDALCEYKHVIEAAELCFGNDKNLNKGLCVDVKSTKIHNMILRGWFKLGWWSKCGEFWEEMDRRGVHKDLHSYSIYMDILCKRGKPWKAVKLYKEMKNKGIKLDVVAYNTVIRAIGFTDGVDMAIRLHREMMELGIRPNVATYNIILKLLCDNWRPKDAYKLLDQMSKRGCEPNVITYHCFFGSLEKPKEILKLFNRMIDSGIRPKMDTYVMLMRKFGRWGFLRPVFFVWKKMEEHGLSPDGFAYNALIDALLQKGMVDMAKKYDEEMMVKGLSPKPRVVLGTQRVPEGG